MLRLVNLNFSLVRTSASQLVRPAVALNSSPHIFKTLLRFQSDQPVGQTATPVDKDYSKLPKFEKPVPKKQSKFYSFVTVFCSGVVAYIAINFYLDKTKKEKSVSINYDSKFLPGLVVPAKSIKRTEENNPGNVKLTLYQYVTCPFCCKVRAYLDYFGYNYDIVEVNSISKDQLDWSPYKKVPVVAVQFPSKEQPDVCEKEIIQLNDSSMIISALETYRLDASHSLKEIVRYFQPLEFDGLTKDSAPIEMNNKYFVMLYNDDVSDRKSLVDRKSEREWRSWVDEKFVHVISPNIYRSLSEAIESFKWFDHAGDWQAHFSSYQRNLIIYLGSTVMYLLGWRLKYKYELKDDVRQSLYEACDEWCSSFSENQVFKGGSAPNLADLALYGVIGSFEGCSAFTDMMLNSKIKNWYEACREQVVNSKGSVYLNNPRNFNPNFNKKSDLDYEKECKEKKKPVKRFGWF